MPYAQTPHSSLLITHTLTLFGQGSSQKSRQGSKEQMWRRKSTGVLLLLMATCLTGGNSTCFQHCRIFATIPDYNRTISKSTKKPAVKPRCVNGVRESSPCTKENTDIRGGELFSNPLDFEDEEEYYDEYDDDDDPPPRPTRPQSRRPPQYDPSRRGRPPPTQISARRGGRYRGPPRSRSGGALNNAANLAKKTVGVTTSAATASLKTSGKAAFYLVSPKHVKRNEVWGVWRIDQQVGKLPNGPFVSCAANVELTPRGDCITKYKDEVYRTPFLFKEKSWPQSCYVEFEAQAFQGPDDPRPVLMLYKGYFRRKIVDRKVIKIVGKIYELRKQRFGRGIKRVQVGTFVARRRLKGPPGGVRLQQTSRHQHENELGEYDDTYDEDDGEEEYDEEEEEYD